MSEKNTETINPTVGQLAGRHRATLVATACLMVAGFWPTLRILGRYWWEDPDFSHGFLVPVISFILAYSARDKLSALPGTRSTAGLACLVGSLAIYTFGHVAVYNVAERIGMWGIFVGALWFLFGGPLAYAVRFPLFFALFSFPPPRFILNRVRLELKEFATRVSSDLLATTGYDANPEGNVLVVGEHILEVADACSGVRSLTAIFATSILFAHLFQTGVLKGSLLVLTSIPVTILVNVLRIIIVAASLVSFNLDLTSGFLHDLVGYAVFGLSLGFLYVSWRFYDWLLRWESWKS
ncbi:MAG: exosortase/archaeosortase family protein [Planctomycetota bacterium]